MLRSQVHCVGRASHWHTKLASHPRALNGSRTSSQHFLPLLSTPGRHTTCLAVQDVMSIAGIAIAGLATALPLSIAADATIDNLERRVEKVTNTMANGVRCYVAKPEDLSAEECAPVVILIHQILGVQQREVELCDDLAARGYVAVVPDTFQGQSTTWIPRALALGYQAALKPDARWGMDELHAVVQWLKQQPWVDHNKIMISGFCYGGGAAVRYAAAHPADVSGVAIFYGRPLLDAAEVAKLQAPVLAMYGTKDKQFPKDMVDKFENDLQAADRLYQVKRYEGQGHAFVTDLRAIQSGGPAGDAWDTFLAFVRSVHGR